MSKQWSVTWTDLNGIRQSAAYVLYDQRRFNPDRRWCPTCERLSYTHTKDGLRCLNQSCTTYRK